MKLLFYSTALFFGGLISAQNTKSDSLDKMVNKQIEAVELKVKKKIVERKVDRLVFNVEQAVATIGGDALDALKATPSVKVSGEQIQLVGKNSVRIMVNDKMVQMTGEDLQNYLKSIPSEQIKAIEVITTPPAKYEAEGNSGLINIQLKSKKHDFWNTSIRTAYQQATYAQMTHGIGFNYKKNKLSILTDINYRYGKGLYTNDIFYHYPNHLWQNKLFNRNDRKTWGSLFNLNYDLTENSTIGIQFLGSFTDRRSDEYADNKALAYTDDSLLKHYKNEGLSKGTPYNYAFNLNYNTKLNDNGGKLSIDGDFFQMNKDEQNNFESILNDFDTNSHQVQVADNNSLQNITNYSLKTDVEWAFSWAKLAFGAKASRTKTKNLVDVQFNDATTQKLIKNQSDQFEYLENNQALYLSTTPSLGAQWEMKARLRLENTQTKGNSISTQQVHSRKYLKLFPTFYLLYKPNTNHSFNINYNKRIIRPSYSQLNPSRWYENSKSYVTGNPFLQPTFIDNISLGYSYKDLITTELYYNYISDQISQITKHNTNENSTIMRHENYANTFYLGGNVSANYKPFPWWQMQLSIYCIYNETKPYIKDYQKSKYTGWGGGSETQNSFTLNKDKTLLATLNYYYDFPFKNIGITASNSSLDIGFKYLALQKQLTIGLVFSDIFRTAQITYKDTIRGVLQSYSQYYDTQKFRFSFNYQLGNKKVILQSRTVGNEEEKKRAN